METTALICDYAEERQGKLYIMGAGWDYAIADRPMSMALAIVVHVPWNETNKPHELRVELLTQDGVPVDVNGSPVLILGKVEMGRPPGSTEGTTFGVPLAVRIPVLSLAAGTYAFTISVDGTVTSSLPFKMLTMPGS